MSPLNRQTVVFALTCALLATIALAYNAQFQAFKGNNYFPKESVNVGMALLLIRYGIALLSSKHSRSYRFLSDVFHYYVVMCVIALLTNAVQLTPFLPVDWILLALEKHAHVDMPKLMSWTAQHTVFKTLLTLSYESLGYQMIALPVLVMILGDRAQIRRYYFLMMFTACIGFSIYYFLPTTAPASWLNSPYFLPEQKATGLKFMQIHAYITPTTMAGGLIALPSFHAIWALLMIDLSRVRVWLFAFILPLNLCLITSCVLLGWHYVIDVVLGGLIVGWGYARMGSTKSLGFAAQPA